jgi:hypothetical protein
MYEYDGKETPYICKQLCLKKKINSINLENSSRLELYNLLIQIKDDVNNQDDEQGLI